MKQPETKLHFIIMVLCFMFGGISFFLFLFQAAPLIQREQFTIGLYQNNSNMTELPEMRERVVRLEARTRGFFYIILATSLGGSIISIFAGLSILSLLKKKETKELTKSIVDTMTTSDEKSVMEEIEKTGGEGTQSELVKATGLSKVKVHRIVKRLELLKIVKKY